jgi:hypothetical protein
LVGIVESANLTGFNISMTFLAFRSTIFFYLFYKSRYIPRALAAWGVFSSAVMLGVSVAMILFPGSVPTLQYGWGPMGIAEVGTALWLAIMGIRQPRASPATGAVATGWRGLPDE